MKHFAEETGWCLQISWPECVETVYTQTKKIFAKTNFRPTLIVKTSVSVAAVFQKAQDGSFHQKSKSLLSSKPKQNEISGKKPNSARRI